MDQPIDEFLSELDYVYQHYEAFLASLPHSLQTLAMSDKRLSARGMNRVHLLFPFWFRDGLGVSLETCRSIALGNACGLLHYIILDWIIDDDEGLGNEWLLLSELFYARAIQCYLSVIPSSETLRWWTYLREAMTQHAQGILWEKGGYKVEDEFDDPGMALMLRGAMFHICGHTLALSSGCDEGSALVQAINYFHAGFNILDDIQDWQQDSQRRLHSNAGLQVTSSEQGGSLMWEHIDAALEKSRTYLTEAKHCVEHLNARYWNAFLDQYIGETHLLKNELIQQIYQSVIVQREI